MGVTRVIPNPRAGATARVVVVGPRARTSRTSLAARANVESRVASERSVRSERIARIFYARTRTVDARGGAASLSFRVHRVGLSVPERSIGRSSIRLASTGHAIVP